MSAMIKKMNVLLADTYALYLKTQNYHWHVKGPHFRSLHSLFETQYLELAEAVDSIAERIIILGGKAPATFEDLNRLKTIKDGDANLKANDMVKDLAKDNAIIVNDINAAIELAQDSRDEGTVNLLGDRVEAHQKAHWMLEASCEQ